MDGWICGLTEGWTDDKGVGVDIAYVCAAVYMCACIYVHACSQFNTQPGAVLSKSGELDLPLSCHPPLLSVCLFLF